MDFMTVECMGKIVVAMLCVATFSTHAFAQELTRRELARRNAPQPVFVERSREAVIIPLSDVVKSADLIIHGDDKNHVFVRR